jgi:pimeloyl-ACP methyl ester carboxylesterase
MMTLPTNFVDICDPGCHSRLRRIAYYPFGREDNPDKVICLHGLTRNGLDFEWLALELAKDFHVICPDMAGRGNSDWLAECTASLHGEHHWLKETLWPTLQMLLDAAGNADRISISPLSNQRTIPSRSLNPFLKLNRS